MVYIFACLWFFFVSKLYPKEARKRVHIFNKIFVQICGDILVVASIVMKKCLYWHQSIKCLVIYLWQLFALAPALSVSWTIVFQACHKWIPFITHSSLTIYFCVMSCQSAHFISSQSFIDANLTLWLPVIVKTEILKKIIILFCRIKKLNYR